MSLVALIATLLGLRRAPISHPAPPRFTDPVQLQDHFAYLLLYAPHFPAEDGLTNEAAFQIAFQALEHFSACTTAPEGRTTLVQCARALHEAFVLFAAGDIGSASPRMQEAAALFQHATEFISPSAGQHFSEPPYGA